MLTLASANTFTGNTLLKGGMLVLENASALQDSTFGYQRQRNAKLRHAQLRYFGRPYQRRRLQPQQSLPGSVNVSSAPTV